jgi:hypothetical protein
MAQGREQPNRLHSKKQFGLQLTEPFLAHHELDPLTIENIT